MMTNYSRFDSIEYTVKLGYYELSDNVLPVITNIAHGMVVQDKLLILFPGYNKIKWRCKIVELLR
jgi:hypothetical protein